MEAEELDNALEELEIRLERLRALYEQYFLGIEKLEPQIPRKDVDRRIHLLRREKIRNTGKRFKLQTLIQRYNTFQQYWQRICREIENGTYKRHIARAEKNIGPTELLTVAARRRFGKERDLRGSDQAPSPASSHPPATPAASSSLPPAATPGSIPPPSDSSITRPPGPRRTPTLRGISTPPPPGADVPISLRPPPPPTAPAAPPASALPAAPAARSITSQRPPPRPSTRPQFESLELDMDFMGDWDPQAAPVPRRAPATSKEAPLARPDGSLARPPAAMPNAERRAQAQQAISELEKAAARDASAAARDANEAAAAQRRLAPPPKPMPKPTRATLDSPTAAVTPAAASAATATLAATEPVRPKPLPPPPAAEPERAPAAPHPVPPPPAGEARRDVEPEPAPNPRPERAESPARAKQGKSGARGPAPTLSDQRLKEVHERLIEAHRSTGQGSSPSYDGLAKSLRAVEAKLRAQHGSNRKVDFEIVVKDGKPVVKPIVR